jgi:hypothetical protein
MSRRWHRPRALRYARAHGQGKPILEVSHDEDDGGWQFLCGSPDLEEDDARVVSLQSIVQRDATIAELADLPLGHVARRKKVDGAWTRGPRPAEG